MKGAWRVILGLLLFWLLVMVYMSTTLYQSNDVTERTERQLTKALQELDALKQQNEELQKLAVKLKDIQYAASHGDQKGGEELKQQLNQANNELQKMLNERQKMTGNVNLGSSHVFEPDINHEVKRRRVENGLREIGYYLTSQLGGLKVMLKDNTIAVTKLNTILEDSMDQQRVMMTDLYNLSKSSNMEEWRRKEAKELSDIMQRRIHYLQNPKDCSTAKKLVCYLNKGCGYGCQIHHVLYCFIMAYGTQRTLVLDSNGWRYSPTSGWEGVFQPLSQTCTSKKGTSSRSWGSMDAIKDVQVVELPIIDSLHPRPPFMPLAIPADLAPRLQRLHGHPISWFMGQFLKYALRPGTKLDKEIKKVTEKLGFQTPIVGVHVRRTDKVGTEAAFHGIEEYMTHVDNYYKLIEKTQRVPKRRVYLATDDPNLLAEARSKFPGYEFISDNDFSRAAGLSTRYSDASLHGIILDIHFLSMSDFLVCTFSSQVCRLAYEIMQAYHPDASNRFRSLDDIYYYGGQNAHNQVVLYPHSPRDINEIELQKGDLVGIAGNHWDGFSKGVNRRVGKTGLYPSYKVEEKIDIFDFPTYPEADKGR